jgi:hypothetical protein
MRRPARRPRRGRRWIAEAGRWSAPYMPRRVRQILSPRPPRGDRLVRGRGREGSTAMAGPGARHRRRASADSTARPRGHWVRDGGSAPAATGLYASVAALLAYAAVGPSRVLVLGPDSSLAPLIAGAVVPCTGETAEHQSPRPQRAIGCATSAQAADRDCEATIHLLMRTSNSASARLSRPRSRSSALSSCTGCGRTVQRRHQPADGVEHEALSVVDGTIVCRHPATVVPLSLAGQGPKTPR